MYAEENAQIIHHRKVMSTAVNRRPLLQEIPSRLVRVQIDGRLSEGIDVDHVTCKYSAFFQIYHVDEKIKIKNTICLSPLVDRLPLVVFRHIRHVSDPRPTWRSRGQRKLYNRRRTLNTLQRRRKKEKKKQERKRTCSIRVLSTVNERDGSNSD